jgi:hypothetical protein
MEYDVGSLVVVLLLATGIVAGVALGIALLTGSDLDLEHSNRRGRRSLGAPASR